MKNCMGDELAAHQVALVECYQQLATTLREHRGDLAPYEQRNAIKALAALWQVMNGLDMDPGPVDDLGA